MGFPVKRAFFALSAVLLLGASPAFSVPLSSGVSSPNDPIVTTDPDGETTQPADESTADARIVDHPRVYVRTIPATEEFGPSPAMTTGGSSSMKSSGHSLALPAAGIGVGGAVLFAVLSHGSHSGDAASSGAARNTPSSLGGPASGGGLKNGGGNGNGGSSGGDDPPTVPEPGTLLMLGAGIASFLGRKKIMSH